MPYFGPDLSALSFYRGMLRDGAGRFFDTFALHPYAKTPSQALNRAVAVRALMDSHGARRKGMWITEFGWASGGPPSQYRARAIHGAQATRLAREFSLFGRYRRRLRLRGLMLWSWTDQPHGRDSFRLLGPALRAVHPGADAQAGARGVRRSGADDSRARPMPGSGLRAAPDASVSGGADEPRSQDRRARRSRAG